VGVIKEQLKLPKKTKLINTLVLSSSKKRLQATHKDYNKNNDGVSCERKALSTGWWRVT
jgi:hypothetical protein